MIKYNVKAFQGHMAEPMKKFRWMQSFGLTEYLGRRRPLIVFGCYHDPDVRLIRKHKGPVILVWMGKDTHIMLGQFDKVSDKKIIHVTWLKQAQEFLKEKGVDCHLIKLPIKEYPRPEPLLLGDKVYAYLQKGKPKYHGSEVIGSLKHMHPLLVGDYSIPRTHWYRGENAKFYSQAFIGLALSPYVGGAMSIQEMAVRGIKVVTNVLSLPNCIPWETEKDVDEAIEKEALKIGLSNNGLVEEVYEDMVEVRGCFNLEKLVA